MEQIKWKYACIIIFEVIKLEKIKEVQNMSILLPGGAGYIGSHTAVELLKKGKDIVIIDNFSNSNIKAIDAIKKITGKDFKFYQQFMLYKIDLKNYFYTICILAWFLWLQRYKFFYKNILL